jgi:hypothetical protein
MPIEKMIDGQRCVELAPDFVGESHYEFLARLAYQYWQARGMPQGSPEVDWVAAEQTLKRSLEASGLVSPSGHGQQDMEREIYPR